MLYDPDRIRQPLRRKGPRGSGRWEEISWDEALADLSTRLVQLRKSGEAHKLAVVCGRERGLMRELWERFATTYGTPNFFDGSSRNGAAVRLACYAMQGVREIPAYDWRSTRYIISLGTAILEASCQAIYFSRAASYLRRGRALGRAKIVPVGPFYRRTAAGPGGGAPNQPGP